MAPGTKPGPDDMVDATATAVPSEEPSRGALVPWEDLLGHGVSKSKQGSPVWRAGRCLCGQRTGYVSSGRTWSILIWGPLSPADGPSPSYLGWVEKSRGCWVTLSLQLSQSLLNRVASTRKLQEETHRGGGGGRKQSGHQEEGPVWLVARMPQPGYKGCLGKEPPHQPRPPP